MSIITAKAPIIALISFFLVFLPSQTHGFVFDLGKKQLEALDKWAGPFAALFIFSFFFFLAGHILLFVSTWLLQGIITASSTALTVTGDGVAEFVRMGWGLTAGIVNLLLIIAFVVIAFAVILGWEKIQLKKALPALIVIALLVNFTLLFVGAGIDISNFLFNTIALQFMAGGVDGQGGNVLHNAIGPLFAFSDEITNRIMVYVIAQTALLLIPYVAVGTQVAWVISILAVLPTITQLIFYGAIMWLLSAVFFLYFVVFLARIFIIQVLAIFAPLAFFCLIFDDTKKLWKQWLDALIQWLFVGVIFIFLMYIGLALAPMVPSLADPINPPGFLKWFTGDIVGHIVLLVYFIVLIGVAKKFIPPAVDALVSGATKMAKLAMPYAGILAAGAAQRIRNSALKRGEGIRAREEGGASPTTNWGRFQNLADNAMYRATGFAHRVAGTSIQQRSQEETKEEVEKTKKMYGDDWREVARNFNHSIATETQRMALFQYLSQQGEEALTGGLTNEQRAGLYELASRRGDTKTMENALGNVPSDADTEALEETERNLLAASGGNITAEIADVQRRLGLARRIQNAATRVINRDAEVTRIREELARLQALPASPANAAAILIGQTELRSAISTAGYRTSARAMRTGNVENFSSDTFSDSFLRAATQTKDLNFIRSLGSRSDGASIMSRINNTTGSMTQAEWDELQRLNPLLCNQIRHSPGAQHIFRELHRRLNLAASDPDRLL